MVMLMVNVKDVMTVEFVVIVGCELKYLREVERLVEFDCCDMGNLYCIER